MAQVMLTSVASIEFTTLSCPLFHCHPSLFRSILFSKAVRSKGLVGEAVDFILCSSRFFLEEFCLVGEQYRAQPDYSARRGIQICLKTGTCSNETINSGRLQLNGKKEEEGTKQQRKLCYCSILSFITG